MKLKYIFASLIATLALAVSCEKEADHYLSEIQLSTSYVSLPVAGGSAKVVITATESWSFKTALPDWLTASATSGSAGETTVTFSADAGEGRTGELQISCGDKTQFVNFIQGVATVSNATCAEIIAGPDAKTYRVTGICTGIYNTTYGNWYLTDDTGTITIYGTLDAKGNTKNFTSLGLEVGDEVTVEGPKTTYGTTVELVDVTVLKINKSLIKVDTVDPEDATIAKEGGEVNVTLVNKGQNLSVVIPEADKEWLSISALDGNVVTLRAAANEGGDRETTVTFKTTDGKKSYSCEQTIVQKGAIVAATVAQFLAAEVGSVQYRVTGVISSVAKADYGNIYIKDYSGEMYVYGVGAKGDFTKLGLKVGDIVTLVGKRGEYKGTAQMTGGQYESHIAVTECSIADFLTKEDSKEVYYMVTGTISSLKGSNGKDNDYGNLYITDGTNELYVYGCYPGYGATGDDRKFFIKNNDIKVGDKLTMIGYKDTYKGLVELCGGICFSFEKAQ